MQTDTRAIERMRAAWAALAPRFTAYELVLPGSPAFICKAERCESHCCRIYSVSLGDRELARLSKWSGLAPVELVESENGSPIALPLAQPYLLARGNGQCALLAEDLRCGQYHGRPEACRLYPHFVVCLDEATGRPVHADTDAMAASLAAVLTGREPEPYVPLLLRHLECPGFTGPGISEDSWLDLFGETFRLQYLPMEPFAGHAPAV